MIASKARAFVVKTPLGKMPTRRNVTAPEKARSKASTDSLFHTFLNSSYPFSFLLSLSLALAHTHSLSFSLLQSHPRTHTLSHWCFLINYSLAEASQPCCWIPSSYNECLYYLLNRSINIDRVRLEPWAQLGFNRYPTKPFLRRCSTATVMKCCLRRQQGTSPCLYKFL